MSKDLKLNLGCGKRHKEGYINVDKFGEPNVRHDLEIFPWPWEDSSVTEIVLCHVLEHLGQETRVYLAIIKEMYRICQDQATLDIIVPHPRHDDFMNDPTHVRAITPAGFELFSKKKNEVWVKGGYANSPLAMYLDVDFEILKTDLGLDPLWADKLQGGQVSQHDIFEAARTYNNVIREIRMVVKVIKPLGSPIGDQGVAHVVQQRDTKSGLVAPGKAWEGGKS